MNMPSLKQITYITGISMSLVLFVILLYSVIPNIVLHSHWDALFYEDIEKDRYFEEFIKTPEFQTFLEIYPNATYSIINSWHDGGRMEVSISDFDSNITLILALDYSANNDIISKTISCHNTQDYATTYSGTQVIPYIETGNCFKQK